MRFTSKDRIFAYFFIFRCRQGNISRTVLSPVSLTPAKYLSVVSLTPVNSFSAVSLTPVMNFRLFGYFWPVLTTLGKNVMAGVNDPPTNCIDDRGLFFLQIGTNRWYLRPPKWDTAANSVIGTAMKSWIHRHPAHLGKWPLRPPILLQTKTAIFSFGGLSGLWSGCVGCLGMQLFEAVPMTLTPSAAVSDFSSRRYFHLSPSTISIPWHCSPPSWRHCWHRQ